MSKRKRRGLGSPPEVHARQAVEASDRAVGQAKAAEASAQRGDCFRAFGTLVSSSEWLGSAFTSILSLPGSERRLYDGRYEDAAVKLRDAKHVFEQRCMKKDKGGRR